MANIDRLQLHTGETDTSLLNDLLDVATNAIQARRYPYGTVPTTLESRYEDLQFRIALDLYNKRGAEGELSHSENGIGRNYESSWVSAQLLREVVPYCGVVAEETSSSDDSDESDGS